MRRRAEHLSWSMCAAFIAMTVMAGAALAEQGKDTLAETINGTLRPGLPQPLCPYHGPIHINGNGAFTAANGVTGGSGTKAAPWIISGWCLSGSVSRPAIKVENVTDYFIIRNVRIRTVADLTNDVDVGLGIQITSTAYQRAVIRGVSITGNVNPDELDIEVDYPNQAAIALAGAPGTLVEDSTFSNVYEGILAWGNDYTLAQRNEFTGSGLGYVGLYSSHQTVASNHFEDNLVGAFFHAGTDDKVYFNNFIDNAVVQARDYYDDVTWYFTYYFGSTSLSFGNYWSDHACGSTTTYSGIEVCSNPYITDFSGGEVYDLYPLANPI